MPDIEYKLQGVERYEQALNDLSSDLLRRVIRGALKDAAAPMVKYARSIAPVLQDPSNKRRQAGVLRAAIKSLISKRYRASSGALGVYITVRATKKQRRASPVSGDPFYFRFVEAGHKIVPRASKSGLTVRQLRARGESITQRRRAALSKVPAHPFLGPAFDAKNQESLRILETAIVERIDKANKAA